MGVFVAFLWGHPEGEGMKDDAGLAELSALWSEALRHPFKRSAG
jgi:hypothetical protein